MQRTSITQRAAAWLERHWYYCGIVAMLLVGWFWPSIGLAARSVHVTPYLVAFAFFLNGFSLSTHSLLGTLRQWRVLLTALVIGFAVSPALTWAALRCVPGGDSPLGHGFQLVSLVPTLMVSAVVLSRLAKGNAAVALYLTIVSNLLAIVVSPALVRLTLGTRGVELDLVATSLGMVYTVLVPTVAGQLARGRWARWATRHARLVTIVSQCTILVFIVTGISTVPRELLTPPTVVGTLAGCLVLHLLLMRIAGLSSAVIGADEPTRRALIFCSAQKSFVFNVLLCEQLFGDDPTMFGWTILPGIIYYLLELALDSVIAQRWSASTESEEELMIAMAAEPDGP